MRDRKHSNLPGRFLRVDECNRAVRRTQIETNDVTTLHSLFIHVFGIPFLEEYVDYPPPTSQGELDFLPNIDDKVRTARRSPDRFPVSPWKIDDVSCFRLSSNVH